MHGPWGWCQFNVHFYPLPHPPPSTNAHLGAIRPRDHSMANPLSSSAPPPHLRRPLTHPHTETEARVTPASRARAPGPQSLGRPGCCPPPPHRARPNGAVLPPSPVPGPRPGRGAPLPPMRPPTPGPRRGPTFSARCPAGKGLATA